MSASEREHLMTRRISELGLSIRGTRIEQMTARLYQELEQKGLAFKPPVYLSDEWGCPDGTPLIGVPFYLADPELEEIERDIALAVETEDESMRYLRHEAGHAYNYAYHLFERDDWKTTFGDFSLPYRERYRADPFSRNYVRHILAWYAQKHPDEDFAETFAVWLTPGMDWRHAYAGWPALSKLEYVDRVLREIGDELPEVGEPGEDDLPVSAMRYTLADHYRDLHKRLPIRDERVFDSDLRSIFGSDADAPQGQPAESFIAAHRREIATRIAYWTGEDIASVREFVDFLRVRSAHLELRVRGLEASTLIELTAFGTAVIMNYRNTNELDSSFNDETDTDSTE